MEAILPISAPAKVERNCRQPVKRAALASELAPSVGLPFRFVVTGLAALFTGFALLATRPDLLASYHYGPEIISLNHLFVLGWLTSLVMGSMYQLVPVALETRLYSERLGKIHFVLHVVGFVGMVWNFWHWNMPGVGQFGSVFGTGVALFVYNLVRTLARIPRWNVIAVGIASGLGWISLTILGGLFAAAAKCWPKWDVFIPISLMHAHAHLGGVGFFVMMIVAVSYKLMPMFTLSDIQNERRAWGSVMLLNAGLLGLFPTVLLASKWKLLFALIIVAGLACYGLEMLAILRARKRKVLDWGLRSFLTALAFLAPLSVLGIVLSWPGLPVTERLGQLENVYGLMAILGVFTFGVLGMLYKIVPFLVWYARYSQLIGRYQVPALADMYSPRLQVGGYWTFLAGLIGLFCATFWQHEQAIFASLLVLGISLGCFALNTAFMFSHLIKPKMIPLLAPQPAKA